MDAALDRFSSSNFEDLKGDRQRLALRMIVTGRCYATGLEQQNGLGRLTDGDVRFPGVRSSQQACRQMIELNDGTLMAIDMMRMKIC